MCVVLEISPKTYYKYRSSVSSTYISTSTNIDIDDQIHTFELESGSQKFDGVQYGTTTIGDTAVSGQAIYLFALHAEWSPGVDGWCKKKYIIQKYMMERHWFVILFQY